MLLHVSRINFDSRILFIMQGSALFPIIEEYIAISPAEDYNVSLTTWDCFMIPLFVSSMLLNGLP